MAAEANKVEPAESEQDEEEDVYEVERIIDMRVEEGEVLYRVRWKNYCSDDDTWEPEAHLEDCREVLLAFKKAVTEAKAKKEAEAKKPAKVLPSKSDVFDADSESDSDKDRPTDAPIKKKKKKKIREEEEEEEEPTPKEKKKKKKKKDKLKEEVKPLPAPETDEEEEEEKVPTPPSPPKERSADPKKRVVESEEDEDELVPSKKHKKDKGKEGLKHRKEKGEGKKKKGKKERKLETSEDEVVAPLEDDLSEGPSESQTDDAPASEPAARPVDRALEDRSRQKGKWEVKLQGIKDLIQDKKNFKKQDAATKDGSLPKSKSSASKGKEDAAPSDSSDGPTLLKKAKSKGQDGAAAAPLKAVSSSTSSASSSSSVTAAGASKTRDDELSKEELLAQKDAAGSTNLFEKFLLNCEAKDRAPRRAPAHPPVPEKSGGGGKPSKSGKLEKTARSSKESPAQKAESDRPDKTKQSDVPRAGQSHGFGLDSEERDESSGKPKPGDESRERRERPEDAQRPGWERRTSADDRKKRREDSEPRLFIACDDVQDPPESADKSDKGQTTLSLGMDLNLDWMSLDDFQKHLNGEDEILSGPPLSPSELRDAVKSGDYMAVKLALNSKEDYNLDQEGCTIGVKRSFEGERSLVEERSSSSSLRLTSNFDSARNEEFTPKEKEIFLQELDGLKNEAKLRRYPVSTNTEQVTESELESIEKVLNDITESAAYGSATKQDGHVNEVQEETQRDRRKGDFTRNLVLNIGSSDLTGNAEQNSPKEANESSDEAEEGEAGNSDSTDQPPAESGLKETATGLLRRSKKPLEKRHPTRSSQRTCRKIIEIPPEVSVDEKERESQRKHFCLYCKMSFVQLAKHLEKKHADETDVAHAIHFPKGSKVRQTLLDEIRYKGDYEHNYQVLKGVDVDTVSKNEVKSPAVSVRDFLPCQHCFTFYRKTDLWRHEQSCKARRGDPKSAEKTLKHDSHSPVPQPLPVSEFLTESCREIIHIMHQDDISAHVRSDPLICKYGNALSAKYDHDKSQFAYIAQKMRELGRFVLAVNDIDKSVKYLHEICLPSKFGLAVEGVKRLSGFDPGSSTFKTISLVSKLGYSLKRAAEIAFGESRMTEDGETETQVKRFIQLLDTKWNGCFSQNAHSSPPKQDVKKVEVDKSTVTEDLIKLYMFIMGEEDDARRELKESPSLSTWKKLSEATLADVCLFNRGRVGNIGRLLSKTYVHKKSGGAFLLSADQVRKSSKLELELGSSFTRLELEGQYGRNMLVLLSKGMVSSIDLLVENRERAGVSNTNPYLFARTEGPSFIRALDCFRRAAMECGVKNPEALLSSALREQIACCWQLLSLNEAELDQVAGLVGRSSQECYMLSKRPSLLEEVSKQLLKMDRSGPKSPLNAAKDGHAQKPALKRRPWSEKEQTAVKRGLSEFITTMKVPGKKECNACIAAEPDLEGRSWTDVKNYVHNTLQTMRRRNNQQKSGRSSQVLNPKRPKAGGQNERTALEDTIMANMTTIDPDHLRESADCCMTMPTHTELRDSSLFTQEMTPTYASLCSTSANMIHACQPLVSTFTPLNATDTQVVPTFTPHNTTNAAMPPAYTVDNKLLPMSSLFTQITTTMSSPAVYASQDTTVSPILPSFTSLTAPSTSMVPTFTHLNAPTAPMIPTFSSLDDSSRPIVSSFTALNSSVAPAFPTSPPQVLTTAQVVPTIHGSNVSDSAPVTQDSTPSSSAGVQPSPEAKPQKRIKRLWSEEEQAAVRRQLGDFCKLVKVPGKKDCDACLAAEPALNTRTWREVKYFVHNSIQSLKRRGLVVSSKPSEPQPETPNVSSEWDGPVYLSL
ncbi:M-phase phosphoprotein 8 isoform X1 [Salarias fasciatus]|uniref:Chromo domain-containing protein n=1 Tax=Salarias fasciatus TaxID=181472 RepID=A0A672IPU1_SALFA|nr:M-phase phosphoprotein 8 isoform X1 [Salarias fasciatus]